MNWKDEYRSKLCNHEEAAKVVKSGDRLLTPIGLGEPSTAAMDAVADRKDELRDVQYVNALVFHPYKIFAPEYKKTFDMMCGFYNVLTMWQHDAGIEDGFELSDVIAICSGHDQRQRDATPVHQQMSLGSFFFPDLLGWGRQLRSPSAT